MNHRRTQDVAGSDHPWSLVLIKSISPKNQSAPILRKIFTKIFALTILAAPLLPADDGFARAGRGRSTGRTVNRSAPPAPVYRQPTPPPHQTHSAGAPSGTNAPLSPSSSHSVPPAGPVAGSPSAAPYTKDNGLPRQGGGFMRNMATAVAGGFLGSMLFSGLSHGLGSGSSASHSGLATADGAPVQPSSGIGLLELLLIGMLGYLGYRVWKNRQEKLALQTQMGRYSQPSTGLLGSQDHQIQTGFDLRKARGQDSWEDQNSPIRDNHRPFLSDPEIGLSSPPSKTGSSSTGLIDSVVTPSERNPSSFFNHSNEGLLQDETQVKNAVRDIFYRIQTAWSRRDLGGVKNLMTSEMWHQLSGDLSEMIAAREINRLDNISITDVQVIKTWYEGNDPMMAVRLFAYMLDYTIDERTNVLVRGSRTEPTSFEEVWIFKQGSPQGDWLLAGIEVT
jgi:predicted lipid-binding transport protein (Tim44 family)